MTAKQFENLREALTRTGVRSAELVRTEPGRTYPYYLCLVFEDGSKQALNVHGVNNNSPTPTLKEMRKAPLYFPEETVQRHVEKIKQRQQQTERQRQASQKRHVEDLLNRLRGDGIQVTGLCHRKDGTIRLTTRNDSLPDSPLPPCPPPAPPKENPTVQHIPNIHGPVEQDRNLDQLMAKTGALLEEINDIAKRIPDGKALGNACADALQALERESQALQTKERLRRDRVTTLVVVWGRCEQFPPSHLPDGPGHPRDYMMLSTRVPERHTDIRQVQALLSHASVVRTVLPCTHASDDAALRRMTIQHWREAGDGLRDDLLVLRAEDVFGPAAA